MKASPERVERFKDELRHILAHHHPEVLEATRATLRRVGLLPPQEQRMSDDSEKGPGYLLPPHLEWARITNDQGPSESETFRHLTRPLMAIRSVDHGRWHLSVSHRDRVPTWEELGIARDALLPEDAWLALPWPPRRYWINHNRRVLHLWAFKDPELQEQFKWEGEMAQKLPTNKPPDGGEEQ